MKQHITVEQGLSLSKEALDRYVAFTTQKGWADNKLPHENILWNIGQMIEFIDEQTYTDDQGKHPWKGNWQMSRPIGQWVIELYMHNPYPDTEYGHKIISRGDELCDALWAACKQILESSF